MSLAVRKCIDMNNGNNWAWPHGAKLALSLVVNVEEGAEYSVADGDPTPEPVDELGVTLKKPIRMHGNESNYLVAY